MRPFDLSPAAEQDLEEIVDFYMDVNPDYADRLLQAISQRAWLQSRMPKIGTDRSSWRPGLRSRVVEGYLVFFVWKQDRLRLARIMHGARDIGADDFE